MCELLLSRVKVWAFANASASTGANTNTNASGSGSGSAVPVSSRLGEGGVRQQQAYALALLMGPWEKRGQSSVMLGDLVSSLLFIRAIIGAGNRGIAYSTKKQAMTLKKAFCTVLFFGFVILL